MSPILVSFICTIFLQQVTAPSPSSAQNTEEISEKELKETILKEVNNLDEVRAILKLAQEDPQKARERIQAYKRKQYSKEMMGLLNLIVRAPEAAYSMIRPILLELDKKLKEESVTYRTFSTPAWDFVEGLGFVWLRIMGITIRSVGDITQIISDIVKAGTTAYYGETPKEKAFETVNTGAEKVKSFGDRLDNGGKVGLENANLRRWFRASRGVKNGEAKSK